MTKFAAVIARWCGLDWTKLGTTVSPAAAGLGAVLIVVGVLIPLGGPRLTQWRRARRTYARLEPLEHELDELLTRRALRLPRPRWSSPATRLVWRQTSIHNAFGHLDAFFDPALYERTLEAATHTTVDPAQAEATAWAAVVAAAVAEERQRDPHLLPADEPGRLPDRAPGTALLVPIADALTRSPLVAAARVRAGTTEGSSRA